MPDSRHSDDDGAAAEKADLMYRLRHSIFEVRASGSFAAFGTIDSFVNPGIFVDPIGILRLPLSLEDAQALAQTSHNAPFGKGDQTLVDESVRKTWQIDAANVKFVNKTGSPVWIGSSSVWLESSGSLVDPHVFERNCTTCCSTKKEPCSSHPRSLSPELNHH